MYRLKNLAFLLSIFLLSTSILFSQNKKAEENDEVESILLDPSKTFKDFGKIKFTELDKIVNDSIDYYDKFGVGSTFTHARE